MRYENTETVTS